MGYTHYWTPKPISAEAWQLVITDFAALFRAAERAGIKLGNAYGDIGTQPEISELGITFNGMEAQSHETFMIEPQGSDWNFTKTAQKPYDAVCVAALVYLAAKHGYTVKTDGEAADWFEGVKLARKAFGGSFLVHVTDGAVHSEWKV